MADEAFIVRGLVEIATGAAESDLRKIQQQAQQTTQVIVKGFDSSGMEKQLAALGATATAIFNHMAKSTAPVKASLKDLEDQFYGTEQELAKLREHAMRTGESGSALGRAWSTAFRDAQGGIQVMQDSLNRLAETSRAAVGSMVGGAVKMEGFKTTLIGVTGSATMAEQELQKLREFADTTPFDTEETMRAGVAMKALGIDTDRFLKVAGNLSAISGQRLPESAMALSKALKGSQEGLEQLRNTYFLTTEDLIKFGAAVNDQGTIAAKSAEKQELLGKAIENLMKAKGWDQIMAEKGKGIEAALSNAASAVFNLTAVLGGKLAPAISVTAKLIEGLAKWLEELPGWFLTAVAASTVLIAILTTLGATIIGAAITIGTLATAFTTLRAGVLTFTATRSAMALWTAGVGQSAAAMQAVATGSTAAAGGITAAGGAAASAAPAFTAAGVGLAALAAAGIVFAGVMIHLTEQEKQAEYAQRQLLDAAEQTDKFWPMAQKNIRATTEELKKLSTVDLTGMMIALQARAELLKSEGQDELAAPLERQAEAIRRVRNERAAQVKAEYEAQKAAGKTDDDIKDQIDSLQHLIATGKIQKREALERYKDLHKETSTRKALAKENKQVEVEIYQLSKELREKDRDATIENLNYKLAKKKASGQASIEDEIQVIDQILKLDNLGVEKRHGYEVQRLQLKQELLKREYDDERMQLEMRLALHQKGTRDQIDLLWKQAHDTRLSLEERKKAMVEAVKMEAAIKDQREKLMKDINDVGRTESQKRMNEIQLQAREMLRAGQSEVDVAKWVAAQKKQLDREVANERKAIEIQIMEAQGKRAKAALAQLEMEHEEARRVADDKLLVDKLYAARKQQLLDDEARAQQDLTIEILRLKKQETQAKLMELNQQKADMLKAEQDQLKVEEWYQGQLKILRQDQADNVRGVENKILEIKGESTELGVRAIEDEVRAMREQQIPEVEIARYISERKKQFLDEEKKKLQELEAEKEKARQKDVSPIMTLEQAFGGPSMQGISQLGKGGALTSSTEQKTTLDEAAQRIEGLKYKNPWEEEAARTTLPGETPKVGPSGQVAGYADKYGTTGGPITEEQLRARQEAMGKPPGVYPTTKPGDSSLPTTPPAEAPAGGEKVVRVIFGGGMNVEGGPSKDTTMKWFEELGIMDYLTGDGTAGLGAS